MSRLPLDEDPSIKSLLEHSEELIKRGEEAIKASSEASALAIKAIRRSDKFLEPTRKPGKKGKANGSNQDPFTPDE